MGNAVEVVRQADGTIRFVSDDPRKAAEAAAYYDAALRTSPSPNDSVSPRPRTQRRSHSDNGSSDGAARLRSLLQNGAEIPLRTALSAYYGREIRSRAPTGGPDRDYHTGKLKLPRLLKQIAEREGLIVEEVRDGREKKFRVREIMRKLQV